jgi:NCAIR mutase (PurE)-related protein
VQSEVDRLAKWLQKHQEESVPDGSKTKLFATIQTYYKAAISAPASEEGVRSAVHELVDVLLKIPEGKLVSAKAKQSAIKWIESLRDSDSACTELGRKPAVRRRLVVMDVASDGSLSVLQPGTSDVMQSFAISNSTEILPRLRVLLEDLGSVDVELEGDRVVALHEEAEDEPEA